MARLNGAHQQLMRKKSGLADDPDYTDPTVAIPGYAGTAGTLLAPVAADGTFDPALAKAWAIVPRRSDGSVLRKIKVKVTFRTAATGAEVAGTFDSTTFAIVARDAREAKATSRPAVEWHGKLTAQPSMKPFVIDVAAFEAMGIILENITAVGADEVYIYAQEWA